jgi:hypothetical protein
MDSMKNTLKKGFVRNIVFKEDDTWYAVGLELNLVIEADTPEIAFERAIVLRNINVLPREVKKDACDSE